MHNITISKYWNSIHSKIIQDRTPILVGKIGATESLFVSYYLQKLPITNRHNLWFASGVFCKSDDSFYEWCESYINGIRACNYIHLWQNYCFIRSKQKNLLERVENGQTDGFLIRQLIPKNLLHRPISAPHDDWLPLYLGDKGWHYKLQNTRVLVVSSAQKTFEKQAQIYHNLWPGAKLGGFESVKVPQSELLTNENLNNPLDWKDKVDMVQKEILGKDFDFAMIGCGGIGLIIADFIKNTMNKPCTYLGGTLQLFFGIRGNRWEKNKLEFYNSNKYWTHFDDEDTPKNYMQFENGGYWTNSK